MSGMGYLIRPTWTRACIVFKVSRTGRYVSRVAATLRLRCARGRTNLPTLVLARLRVRRGRFATPRTHGITVSGRFTTRRGARGRIRFRARLSGRGLCDSGSVGWTARTR
jgi:hypothetical protein